MDYATIKEDLFGWLHLDNGILFTDDIPPE
jgi:hypothetical protein